MYLYPSDYVTDLTTVESIPSQLKGKISKSFGFGQVKKAIRDAKKATEANVPTYNVVATMRLERYYSSVWESDATLVTPAAKSVDDEEFVTFFMTCGPNYIRSLKRGQEVTAIFTYESSDLTAAQQFARLINLHVHGNQQTATLLNAAENSDILSSLSIDITAFGVGLNTVGEDSLVATTLDGFNDAMRFAFDSMTKNNSTDSADTGLVYSMEVVPWTDNPEFLQRAGVNFNTILSPVPRHLMPKSYTNSGSEDLLCVDPLHYPDDFGKCCEAYELTNVTSPGGVEKFHCVSAEYVAPYTLKENMEVNAEFVVLLQAIDNHKHSTYSSLNQCLIKLRELPESYDYDLVLASDSGMYDEAIDNQYTVKELKAALDLAADLRILNLVAEETNEFMEMFYSPCLAALYGKTLAEDKEIDPSYFMAQPWYNHPECAMTSCLEQNKAWDRRTGTGCHDSILGRKSESTPKPNAFADSDEFCATILDTETGLSECRYLPEAADFTRLDQCRQSLPKRKDGRGGDVQVPIAYLLNYFCSANPETGDQADSAKMDEADRVVDEICVS